MRLLRAKTKRRLKHLLLRKRLVGKRTSRRVMRTAVAAIAMLMFGALVYDVTTGRPTGAVTALSEGRLLVARATPAVGAAETGRASWYAFGLRQPDALTCASRTYPRGTHLEVTNLRTDRIVVCQVNDYGPAIWTGRIIDLSRGSFSAIDNLSTGTAPVRVRPLGTAVN